MGFVLVIISETKKYKPILNCLTQSLSEFCRQHVQEFPKQNILVARAAEEPYLICRKPPQRSGSYQSFKGVKIAIMGCIVNGPGEMADADFGYVGSGVGKITLYRGKEIIKRQCPKRLR